MAERYAREAARLAALQMIDSAKFDLANPSCAEIMADLLLRYIRELGAGSHHYAELAGRSETNPVDVEMALKDLGTNITQLTEFLRKEPEVPFEHNISAFPLRKKSRPPPTFLERGEQPPPHIPPWLPALPDRHTYQATPVYAGQERDPQKRQMQLTEQRQTAETAVVRLQARLAADNNLLLAAKLPKPEEAEEAAGVGAAASGAPSPQQQVGAAAAAGNPFFAAPWGDVAVDQQQQQQQPAAAAAAPGAEATLPSKAGPTAEWEAAALEAGGGGAFPAQAFFATQDWKVLQERRARIANSGRPMHEAFGEAYDEQAAARSGKRQKRSGGPSAAAVAAAAANDPTRARVEGILASMQPALPVAGAAGGVDEVMHEQI